MLESGWWSIREDELQEPKPLELVSLVQSLSAIGITKSQQEFISLQIGQRHVINSYY